MKHSTKDGVPAHNTGACWRRAQQQQAPPGDSGSTPAGLSADGQPGNELAVQGFGMQRILDASRGVGPDGSAPKARVQSHDINILNLHLAGNYDAHHGACVAAVQQQLGHLAPEALSVSMQDAGRLRVDLVRILGIV